jgi:ABC-2 type transport system ATP-binding protein
VYAEDAGALVVSATQAVAEAGLELRDLHLARPSLEDVFIYLTGRNLR